MMKLVENRSGTGELMLNGTTLRQVRYTFTLHQGFTDHSGLPVPGLHRLEGRINFDPERDSPDWIGIPLALRVEDGRVLAVTLVGADGRLLSEGHGPSKCSCC
jgi:hypothetical protein